MTLPADIAAFLRFYPRIYFACHRRHVRDAKARRTLSLNQASILDHLDDVEPTNLRSLARHMGVTASTMSLNIDRLEAAGYVRRERDRRDARRVELRLTESGNRLKQQQGVLDPAMVGVLFKRLKASDRAKALHGLKLFAQAAAEMAAAK
jgi:DNA-binding MarR family transcriptional regulator